MRVSTLRVNGCNNAPFYASGEVNLTRMMYAHQWPPFLFLGLCMRIVTTNIEHVYTLTCLMKNPGAAGGESPRFSAVTRPASQDDVLFYARK